MIKPPPTSVVSTKGYCPPGSTVTTCCRSRSASHEIAGSYKRMFRQYGRSKSWFSDRSSVVANLPNGVTWEDYYYTDSYKYNLSYETTGATSSGTTGTISITLRAHVTTHALKPKLVVAAPNLFTKLTAADITAAFTGWKAALQTHWTNRNYKVHLGAPDCPGVFTIKFSLVAESDPRKAHVSLGVLNMKHPKDDPHWAKILKNPGSGKFGTAKELVIEWRSNARDRKSVV